MLTSPPFRSFPWCDRPLGVHLNTSLLREEPAGSFRAERLLSDGTFFENRVIFGDNLVALRGLQTELTGTITCAYIDPPYNTGNTFPHYRDGLVHERWLSMMRPRLELLWALLRDDGFLAVQIDDHEFARLYLLMAEICQERNLKVIVVKMAEPTGVKMAQVAKYGRIARLKEYLILAGKGGIRGLSLERVAKDGWDDEYRIGVDNVTRGEMRQLKEIIEKKTRTPADLQRADAICVNLSPSSMKAGYRKMLGVLFAPARQARSPNNWPTANARTSRHTCRHSRSRPRNTNSM
jgi:adenine-specific DNA-methyltransferase